MDSVLDSIRVFGAKVPSPGTGCVIYKVSGKQTKKYVITYLIHSRYNESKKKSMINSYSRLALALQVCSLSHAMLPADFVCLRYTCYVSNMFPHFWTAYHVRCIQWPLSTHYIHSHPLLAKVLWYRKFCAESIVFEDCNIGTLKFNR